MVNEDDLKLKLLAGLPISIDNFVEINPLQLKDIIHMGESEYNKILSYLLIDKNNIEEMKDKEISNLELMMIQSYYNEDFKNIILKGLHLFTKKDFAINQDGYFYFVSDNGENILLDNKDIFAQFQFILRKANLIKENKEEEYNPGNDKAKEFIEKLKKRKQILSNSKKKKDIDLHSIISGVTWKGTTDIFNVLKLTIYQLYDAFYRLENIDNYHYTLTGIYAGTVDGKKINLKNINWAKVQDNS